MTKRLLPINFQLNLLIAFGSVLLMLLFANTPAAMAIEDSTATSSERFFEISDSPSNLTENVPEFLEESNNIFLSSAEQFATSELTSQTSAQVDDIPQKEVVVTSSTTSWSDGIYVIDSEVLINERVEVSGTVTLTWDDRALLGINGGIHVPYGSKLIIDGHADAGQCIFYGTKEHASDAIIGGNANEAAGVIEIRNGNIDIRRSAEWETLSGAAIGNGESGSGGEVFITGGNVNIGSEFDDRSGAGIGNGEKASGIKVEISGGNVYAAASDNAAGVGGGASSGDASIIISGGNIRVGPHGSAPAIGAPIQEGFDRTIQVTITGGQVNSLGYGSSISAPSIGGLGSGSLIIGSQDAGKPSSCILYLESIEAPLFETSSSWDGIVFLGLSGVVYGNALLAEDLKLSGDTTIDPSGVHKLTIPIGASLTVPEGIRLTIYGGSMGCVVNNGTLRIKGELDGNNGSEGYIAFGNNGILYLDNVSSTFLGDTSSWNAVVFIGNDGSLYGNPILNNDLHVTSNQTLTIPAGKTFAVPKNVMLLDDGAIVNNGTVCNEGTIDGAGSFENNGVLEGSGIFFPQMVEFDTNGGSKIDSIRVNRESAIGSLISEPIRNGFHFDGWFVDNGWLEPWDLATNKVVRPTTLYAKWVAIPVSSESEISSTAPVIPTIPVEPADYEIAAETILLPIDAPIADAEYSSDVPRTCDTSLPFPVVFGVLALFAILRLETVRRKTARRQFLA